jgi:uncharacterized membrane protein YfcA
MTPLDCFYLGLIALGAGAFGAMLGVGGGVIMVPLMVAWFHVPMGIAVPASLLGIIATSSASSLVYLRQGLTDLSLATRLLIAPVAGAVVGTWFAKPLFGTAQGQRVIAGLFAIVILAITVLMFRRRQQDADSKDERKLTTAAHAAVFGGGILSSLLGIGGGIVNVPVITLLVGAPVRVAIATSAYMLGVTAASGAAIYAWRGQMDPLVAGPAVVGIFVGAQVGARLAGHIPSKGLRVLFCLVLLYNAYNMAAKAVHHG